MSRWIVWFYCIITWIDYHEIIFCIYSSVLNHFDNQIILMLCIYTMKNCVTFDACISICPILNCNLWSHLIRTTLPPGIGLILLLVVGHCCSFKRTSCGLYSWMACDIHKKIASYLSLVNPSFYSILT